jgi:pyruvate dehydrogenase E1 component beta subunit
MNSWLVTGLGSARRTVVVQSQKKQMMMWEALREATDEEMERDPTVCVMGEKNGSDRR